MADFCGLYMDGTFWCKGMKKKIVMLLDNPCIRDSRVIKEAESLVKNGYSVFVLCYPRGNFKAVERKNGVIYVRMRVIRRNVFLSETLERKTQKLKNICKKNAPLFFLCKIVSYIIKLCIAPIFILIKMDRHNIIYNYIIFKNTAQRIKPSFIHSHDLQMFFSGYVLSKTLQSFFVIDSHEMGIYVSNPPKGIFRKIMQSVERFCMKRADIVFTVSKEIKQYFQEIYHLKNIHVLYNAPDVTHNIPCVSNIRKDACVSDAPIIVWVGGISFGRGFFYLLEALSILKNFKLVCVGMINQKVNGKLKDKLHFLGLEDRFQFVTAKSSNELIDYISTADISVIPYERICLNHEYCMPNKLFESLFARVPLVVNEVPSLKNFINEYNLGLSCDVSDAKQLAAAIKYVYLNKELYKMDDKKYEKMVELFSWKAQEKKLIQAYDSLKKK